MNEINVKTNSYHDKRQKRTSSLFPYDFFLIFLFLIPAYTLLHWDPPLKYYDAVKAKHSKEL